MKAWLNKLYLPGIIILTAVIYWDSFTSRFFQDDKLLLATAKMTNLLKPIPDFHYHPISNQLFYLVSRSLFGLNPLGFHLLEFGFFALTLALISKISRVFLKEEYKCFLAVFFFALNISLFAFFFWIAVSYFVFGTFFFFLTLYLFLAKRSTSLVLLSFLFALLSNEVNFLLPFLLFLTVWYLKIGYRKLLPLGVLEIGFLLFKIFYVGFPKSGDYKITFGLVDLKTFEWYILRAFNLPEGVRNGFNQPIIYFFLLFLAILTVAFVISLRKHSINFRMIVFSGAWFILGAAPFYFLPNHLSAYYLTLALFGPIILWSKILTSKSLAYLAPVTYLLLTVFGLDLLRHTHWIILKNTGPIGKF